MEVSFVVPAKNEFPQVIWTIYSLIEHLPSDLSYEVILVDDASTDETSTFLEGRGLETHGKLKIVKVSPDNKTIGGKTGVGCWRARTQGLKLATGKYVVFADAHIIVHGDTLKRMLSLLQNPDVGLVHCPVASVGDDPQKPYLGYAYKTRLEGDMWGSWTHFKLRDEPYKICMGGFALSGAKKRDLDEIGVWHDGFLGSYSGGEQYIDLKFWLLGKTVWLDPLAWYSHYTHKRGYAWTNECYYHNKLVAAYCIGGEEQLMKSYGVIPYKQAVNLDLVRKVCQIDRADILERQTRSLLELVKCKPWDFPA